MKNTAQQHALAHSNSLDLRNEKLNPLFSPSPTQVLKSATFSIKILSITLTILNQFLFTLDSTPQRSPLQLMIPRHNANGDI